MESINHLSEDEEKWFAIYTGYKKEKTVHKFLEKKGIQSYLPLQKFTRRYTRKVREVSLPLFSCYLFVKILKSQYVSVLETQYVHRFVKIKNDIISIPESEIELVRRVENDGTAVQLSEHPWAEGDLVEVIGGKLTGLKGKLIRSSGKQKFLIQLDQIGFGLEMEIDANLLSKVNKGKVVI